MIKPDSLTMRILHWQKTGEGFQEIMEEIYYLVIRYPMQRYGWPSDRCCDFYCFFYPRCLILLRYFRYQERSFAALLNNSLNWQLHSFYRSCRRREQYLRCVQYDCTLAAEEVITGNPPDTDEECSLEVPEEIKIKLGIGSDGRAKDEWTRRRMLIFTLKNAPFLSEAHITALSVITGTSRPKLAGMVARLSGLQEKHRRRLAVFALRMNRAYIEICRIHRSINDSCSCEERQQLLCRLGRVRTRLECAREGRSAVKLSPTNAEIAKILGIPKGSIDSGLYYLKKTLE